MVRMILLMFQTRIHYLLKAMLLHLSQVLGWTHQMVKETSTETYSRMVMDLQFFSHVCVAIDDQVLI